MIPRLVLPPHRSRSPNYAVMVCALLKCGFLLSNSCLFVGSNTVSTRSAFLCSPCDAAARWRVEYLTPRRPSFSPRQRGRCRPEQARCICACEHARMAGRSVFARWSGDHDRMLTCRALTQGWKTRTPHGFNSLKTTRTLSLQSLMDTPVRSISQPALQRP